MSKALKVSASTWHQRLGHLHTKATEKIPQIKTKKEGMEKCDICIQGKMRKKSFPK